MIRLLLLLLLLPAAALARPAFTPEIGTQLDASATFTDADGHTAPLSDILKGKPALLILGYHTCPNLCGVVQTRLADALAGTDLPPDAYRALFVSVAANETPDDAAANREKLATAVPDAPLAPWRFLTGPGGAMARTLGLETEPRPRTDEYVHPIAVFALTPDARLARVLPAATFGARDTELALVEASEGKLGTLADKLYLLCAGFDATKGQYTPAIMAAVRGGGVVALLTLGAAVLLLSRRRS
ncbi:SCO family protein [Psychromarinibacter sp. C21-152]|uniref:SCO family protein n=1 Tax=Psychromarinibacter sediminicola TaxID=3033385 RepID=A0AAE3NVA0_9RHOB|nr:SCO family protein [Psychromarinibacter sediminicola]MDF0602756.1 SCO family protein [Psychromarinibacter sediminicola]